MTDTPVMLALGEDYPELREAIRKICERYPGAYWRRLEAEQAYPSEFIKELTAGGFLAALIPEEYGGAGLPLRAAAGTAAKAMPRCTSWARSCGTAAKSRSGAICRRSPRANCACRLSA